MIIIKFIWIGTTTNIQKQDSSPRSNFEVWPRGYSGSIDSEKVPGKKS
jgi:hypothetical protein